MWVSKKYIKSLEKRIADLEVQVQSQHMDEEKSNKALQKARELLGYKG